MGIMNSFVNDIKKSALPSRPGRSRRPCACCCPRSWPSTRCPRAPRRSPSTPAPIELL
ncbi:rCG45225 [Rattus norvegicus]|uniref:RCG45225 n=1 Tax=Rattus norvegicus TaxID=10116 RepID=A6KLP0_RAT|nr:rCG45225 [Rattus norvegicus]